MMNLSGLMKRRLSVSMGQNNEDDGFEGDCLKTSASVLKKMASSGQPLQFLNLFIRFAKVNTV